MGLQTGTRLGNFEVVAPLGSGGMGEVYRARDTRLRREVALKVLPETVASQPDRLQLFEAEAQTAGQLNHPNVLTVYEVGAEKTTRFIATELLEGETLQARLRWGPLPRNKAVEYAIAIARGLAAAHERGIVHCDLKPSNLFLTNDGRLKILDFGLARLALPEPGTKSDPLSRTASDTAVSLAGTVGYIAPEQLRGEVAGPRADLFALGAVLYEMLTGERAFSGNTPIEAMSGTLHLNPLERRSAGRLPPALVRVLHRCLEKSPLDRFQSAHDLSLALEAVSGPAGRRPPRRRYGLVAAGVGLAAAAALLWRWEGSRPPPAQASALIAVLPIDAPAGDGELQLVALSIMDLVAHRLSAMPGLRLLKPDLSATPPPPAERLQQLTTLRRPDRSIHALRGTLRRAEAAGRGRLSLELVEVGSQGQPRPTPLGEYDIPFLARAEDLSVFTGVREAVVGEVLRLIVPALRIGPEKGLSPRDPEAYRLYLLGVRDLRGVTCGGDANALASLRRSVEMEPRFAPAWEELAWAYYGHVTSCGESRDNYDQALRAADHALSLVPDRPRALGVKAVILAETSRAEAAYELVTAAATKAPDNLDLMFARAYVLTYAGFLDEAIAETERAAAVDPMRSTTVSWSTNALLHKGDVDRFRSLQLGSGSPLFRYYRGYADLLQGRMEEAKRVLAPAYRDNPNDLFGRLAQAVLETIEGRRERARILLRQIMLQRDAMGASDGEITYKVALLLARAGASDEALTQLDRAVSQGFFCPSCLENEPSLAPLRTAPRYLDALAAARARHERFAKRFGLAPATTSAGLP